MCRCVTECFASVAEGDAVFVVKLQDYTATEKDEVTLNCELSKDVPVIWYHNDTEVIASKMVVMKSEGVHRSLLLRKVEHSSLGEYKCDCGTDKTTANLNIEGESAARLLQNCQNVKMTKTMKQV